MINAPTLRKTGKTLQKLSLIGLMLPLFSLQGCMNVALSGVQATYNRYNISNSVRDQYITIQADRKIHWYSHDFQDSNVIVSTFNCVVVLTGEVQSQALHDELTDLVKDIPNVAHVYNLTTVRDKVSIFTTIQDDWITAKIKTRLMSEVDVDPSQIKVITENGVVYLIGTVFPDQAQIATDIARQTSGVERVVRIFSYLKITKTPNE